MEEKCNICNSLEKKLLIFSNFNYIVKCKICGLIYRIPQSLYSEEIKKYKELPFDIKKQDIIDKSKYKIFIKYIKKIITRFKNKDIYLLDIGCSSGFFIQLAVKHGIKSVGIEISKSASKIAKERLKDKALIYEQPLKQINFSSNFFDIVTLWDVLDHIADPLDEIKEIFRILKNNGILILRVRNGIFHIFIFKLMKIFNLKFLTKPATFHLYSFTPKTINKLLKKAGFKKISIYNSELTIGDPYQQSKNAIILELSKKIFSTFSQIIFYITFCKILISPSLIICAEK